MKTRTNVYTHAARRVALWFASLLASAGLFALFFTGGRDVGPAFWVTMKFALPGWLLYLPLVFTLPNANGWRGWVLFGTGVLIGPASLCGWMLFLIVRGADAHSVWYGDPLAPSSVGLLIFGAFVGGLAAGLYALGLKLIPSEPSVSQSE